MWKEGAEESAQRDGGMRKSQQARVALKVEEGPVNPGKMAPLETERSKETRSPGASRRMWPC